MSEKRFRQFGLWVSDDVEDKYLNVSQVVDVLNEQQDTIFKLQDLCGKSDGENMKLRIENKRLQKELNDCEKFRYTTFKRMRDVLDE